MKELGNVLWLICGGALSAAFWGLLGLLLCATVVGMPLGKQCFKLVRFAAWPFGQEMESNFGKHPVANVVWLLTLGVPVIVIYVVLGALFSVTILGIPFGKQYFKLAVMSMGPFGLEFEDKTEVIKEWEEWKNW